MATTLLDLYFDRDCDRRCMSIGLYNNDSVWEIHSHVLVTSWQWMVSEICSVTWLLDIVVLAVLASRYVKQNEVFFIFLSPAHFK